ncbi:MAG: hypothetical protein JW896_06575 [Deltaproteobacteria bacterium]|nr:hypothetical protein [Deltaproteobacteria bacterium]
MKRFMILLTIAVFTIIAISSCTCMRYACMRYMQPTKDIKKPILVKIKTKDTDGKKPKVVPGWVMLRYGTNQQVEWKIDEDVEFTIKFNNTMGSPFEIDEFDNKHNKSGRVLVDPGEKDKAYWYSVVVDGFEAIDPGIIVWD